jgi:hypothetical protein
MIFRQMLLELMNRKYNVGTIHVYVTTIEILLRTKHETPRQRSI